jgi:hypothetical protein
LIFPSLTGGNFLPKKNRRDPVSLITKEIVAVKHPVEKG